MITTDDLKNLNTPEAKYHVQIIEAVQKRWYDLLESRRYQGEATGEAVLIFRLHSDGSVSDVSIATNSVDLSLAKLAESAIKDAAPFTKWPDEMRSRVGADVRKVTFKFFYEPPYQAP